MFNLTLTEELYRSVDQMGLTLDDLKRQTILAAESAFLPDSERENLVDQFQNWLYPETSPLR
jgi:adenosine deaminase